MKDYSEDEIRLIVAGSREGVSRGLVHVYISQWIEEHGVPDLVVHGDYRGVDTYAKMWAKKMGIPTKPFPANWKKYGKRAGPLRNQEMAEFSTHLLVIHTPNSKGSRDMKKAARRVGLHITDHIVKEE